MNKWQKIASVIVFGAIAISLTHSIKEIEANYIHQDLIGVDNRVLWDISPYIHTLTCLAVGLYFIAVTLFICLWRKGGKR